MAGMQWSDTRIRGAGHVVEVLAVSWRGSSLAALKNGPLSPPELLAVFKTVQPSTVPVFGPHAVYIECVKRHLAVLARVSRLLRDPRVRQDLLAAESSEKVLAIIREAEGRL